MDNIGFVLFLELSLSFVVFSFEFMLYFGLLCALMFFVAVDLVCLLLFFVVFVPVLSHTPLLYPAYSPIII